MSSVEGPDSTFDLGPPRAIRLYHQAAPIACDSITRAFSRIYNSAHNCRTW